jgi:hypothetical protein
MAGKHPIPHVRRFFPSRLMFALLTCGMLLALPACLCAQEDGEAPLGDVARSFRKKPNPSDAVIDNDNFSKVMDDAESRRAAGSSLVFSFVPGANNFHVSTPDVTCSLSFSAKTSSLLSDPIMLDELPRTELAKLDGPAFIDGDSLQVSVHNGTSWELKEVVIGLTIVRSPQPGETKSTYDRARIVPAKAGGAPQQMPDTSQKQPDVTMLLRVKGSAAPSATAIFRTPLNFALFPDQEWHWAIVKAKGIPPQTPLDLTVNQPEPGKPEPATGGNPSAPGEPAGQTSPQITSPSNPAPSSVPSNPDPAAH